MRNRPFIFITTLCSLWLTAFPGLAQAPRYPKPCDDPSLPQPCGYQIRDVDIQPSPSTLKFQARVSQAKLPIGQATFNEVNVHLLRGNDKVCDEKFTNVQVVDSVINLSIGRNISCELDQVIAENAELSIQVCLGGDTNCLRPIALGSTPYAIRATFARSAQEAHLADLAGQANYAHRATADPDMFLSKKLGYGYFDFATPQNKGLLYSSETSWAPYAQGGFLQWAPLSESKPTLHICAADDATHQVTELSTLVLASRLTETTGGLLVHSEGLTVNATSTLNGSTTITGKLDVKNSSDTTMPRGLDVSGPTTLQSTLNVAGNTAVTGKLTVAGDADFTNGQVTMNRLKVLDVLEARISSSVPISISSVTGNFLIPGTLTVQNKTNLENDLAVTKGGAILLSANTEAAVKAMSRSADNKLLLNPGGGMASGAQVESGLTVTGGLSVAQGASFNSTLRTTGEVTLGTSTYDGVQIGKGPGHDSGGPSIDLHPGTSAFPGATTADDHYAGEISFRPSYARDALTIVGAGPDHARVIKLYDILDVVEKIQLNGTNAMNASSTTLVVNPGGAFSGGARVESNLAVQRSVATASYTSFLHVRNNSDGASAHANIFVEVNGASAGNPFIGFNVPNRVGWSAGVDNTSQKFKIAPDVFNVNTNTALSIDSATGDVTVRGKLVQNNPAVPVCRDLNTGCQDNDNNRWDYLNRHNIVCLRTERLVSWRLDTNVCGSNKATINYTCCQ